MDRSIALRLTAAVWIANVAVTALAIHGLEHPQPYVPSADTWRPTETKYRLTEDTKAEADPPATIEMPMATIVAEPPGRALMQGTPDVVIGPGIVTHPSTNPPRTGH